MGIVHAAAAVSIGFVLVMLLRAERRPVIGASREGWRFDVAILAAAAVIPFLRNLRAPFVYDDYGQIRQISRTTWPMLAALFRPAAGEFVFRPVGFVSYWLDYRWAGGHAARWHAWSIGAHAANTGLVYLLLRRCRFARLAALPAALLFALHGSRAETIAWVAPRFDLIATFFTLCALLAALEYCRGGGRLWFVPMAICCALAAYTKESAFCLPLLLLALLPLLPGDQRRRAVTVSAALFVLCAILFAYRWYAIGGLGGYPNPLGSAALWHSPLHIAESVFFRQWAVLFFPVNWTVPLEWWLCGAGIAFIGLLIACMARVRVARAGLYAGLAFLFASVIPVQHLLMFQPDFAGARVLYLPAAGLAIVWAAIFEQIPAGKPRFAAAAVLVAFNLAALEHNLRPWRTTPAIAAAICRAFGQELAKDTRAALVTGLPERLNGVYFLSNAFPECVEMNSGEPAAHVHMGTAGLPPSSRHFIWSPEHSRLEEVQ